MPKNIFLYQAGEPDEDLAEEPEAGQKKKESGPGDPGLPCAAEKNRGPEHIECDSDHKHTTPRENLESAFPAACFSKRRAICLSDPAGQDTVSKVTKV